MRLIIIAESSVVSETQVSNAIQTRLFTKYRLAYMIHAVHGWPAVAGVSNCEDLEWPILQSGPRRSSTPSVCTP
jgi:hypothetical protein